MTVLGTNELKKRIHDEELFITPLIFPNQIQESGIDVRLGTEFLQSKKPFSSIFDPKETASDIQHQEKVKMPLCKGIILHPHEFILGSTLEYCHLPLDLIAYVIGRSSWARLGLIIATATVINPGFSGTITFEISNLGTIPIKLYPGTRIGQLIFHTLDKPTTLLKSRYHLSTGPSFSRIWQDDEWNIMKKIEDKKGVVKSKPVLRCDAGN